MSSTVSETKRPTSTTEYQRDWRSQINQDYLKSCDGVLKIGQLVSMVTSISALAHYKIIVSNVNLIYYMFMTANVLVCLVNIVLFLVCLFALDKYVKKLAPRTSKVIMMIFPAFVGHLLLVLTCVLAVEAVHVKTETNANRYSDQKCIKCSKINIATVFGFVSWIFFTIELIKSVVEYRQVTHRTRQEVTHTEVQEIEQADKL